VAEFSLVLMKGDTVRGVAERITRAVENLTVDDSLVIIGERTEADAIANEITAQAGDPRSIVLESLSRKVREIFGDKVQISEIVDSQFRVNVKKAGSGCCGFCGGEKA
jgi:hypothetical protein